MDDIDRHKKQMFAEYWVEQRHEYLESLPVDMAKQVLEALDDEEVGRNVNVREAQQDYIADYLQYVWSISPYAFWRHVYICLQHPEGHLLSDNPFYLHIMRDERMPDQLWDAVLEYLSQPREDKWLVEDICEIIMGQTEKGLNAAKRRAQIVSWIRKVTPEQRSHATTALRENLGAECANRLLGESE